MNRKIIAGRGITPATTLFSSLNRLGRVIPITVTMPDGGTKDFHPCIVSWNGLEGILKARNLHTRIKQISRTKNSVRDYSINGGFIMNTDLCLQDALWKDIMDALSAELEDAIGLPNVRLAAAIGNEFRDIGQSQWIPVNGFWTGEKLRQGQHEDQYAEPGIITRKMMPPFAYESRFVYRHTDSDLLLGNWPGFRNGGAFLLVGSK